MLLKINLRIMNNNNDLDSFSSSENENEISDKISIDKDINSIIEKLDDGINENNIIDSNNEDKILDDISIDNFSNNNSKLIIGSTIKI